jgi:hypothetical protein
MLCRRIWFINLTQAVRNFAQWRRERGENNAGLRHVPRIQERIRSCWHEDSHLGSKKRLLLIDGLSSFQLCELCASA